MYAISFRVPVKVGSATIYANGAACSAKRRLVGSMTEVMPRMGASSKVLAVEVLHVMPTKRNQECFDFTTLDEIA